MGNRPSSTTGIQLPDPLTYDPYSKGYKTGVQSSIFIGPIWVEEVVSISIKSGTSDIPIYGYSNPYYGDILLGNYQVTGQIAISYIEPDYLLRIINTAKQTSIKDSELAALIESRKSIFLDTIKYKLRVDGVGKGGDQSLLTEYATRYVNRITREVETTVLNTGGTVRSNAFELTIITGNIDTNDQTIDIYEGIKIMGSGKAISTDDSTLIELYEFIGRRKPERVHSVIKPRQANILSKSNLMKLAKEVATKLVDRVMQPPTFKTLNFKPRVAEMLSTDKISIAGAMPKNARFYGKECSFAEISFALEYDPILSKVGTTDPQDITSDSQVEVYKSINSNGEPIDSKLTCPILLPETKKGFDNRFGRIVSPDRVNTAKHVTAIAPISPMNITHRIGGSIVMPRYSTMDFTIGSYYPPDIVDLTMFDYTDADLDLLTAGTLWCNTLGFRSTNSSNRAKNNAELTSDELADDTFICDIAQPYNTMCIIDNITSEWTENADSFKFIMDVPRSVDYINTQLGSGRFTKAEMVAGKKGHTFEIRMSTTGTTFNNAETRKPFKDVEIDPQTDAYDWISIKGPLVDATADKTSKAQSGDTTSSAPADSWAIYENSEVAIYYEKMDVPPMSPIVPETLVPHYFEIVLTLSSSDLAASLNKNLYITPFVYVENDTPTAGGIFGPPTTYSVTIDPEKTPAGVDIGTYFNADNDKTNFQRLAYFMKTRNGSDDSCNIKIAYDCTVVEQAGYYDSTGRVRIYGVYFLNNTKDYDSFTADDGTTQSRSDLGYARQLHVTWFASVTPILAPPEGKDAEARVDISHSIEGRSGRYLEIYNITRCDAMLHNMSLLADLNAGIYQELKNALIYILRSFMTIDAPVTSYTYPIKAKWDRFAGFLRGYALRIEYGTIVEQLMNCSFTSDNMNSMVGRDPGSDNDGRGWTLQKALSISEETNPSKSSGQTSVEVELTSMVTSIIEDKISVLGGHIIDNDTVGKTFIVDMEVLMPANEVLIYGLSADGYKELEGYTQTIKAAATGGTSITLGGYTE